jgi:beta-glucosidase
VDRLLDLIFASAAILKKDYRYDEEGHHLLAKKIALSSAVLLKNEEGILPVPKGKKVALIGELAKYPRYQGAGSSHINPTRLSSAIDGFNSLGYDYTYYPGYALKGTTPESLLAEAVAGAKECDLAIIFAGLPDQYESEGYDRVNLSMPDSHNTLIARVAEVNPNTVVVLAGGAPVEMPWLSKVKVLLNMYLAGQAGGLAAAELLAGIVNPSGKLAETYPQRYADVPSAGFYETGRKQAQYREGIYVGYRYYDKARKDVLFPFGHGLSYTAFEYHDLVVSHSELHTPYEVNVSVTLRNKGSMDGAEVVQLYVSDLEQPVFRPEKELKEFTKVFLKAGEQKQVTFTLNSRSFAIYDATLGDWVVPGGAYNILVGASSRDIRLRREVKVYGQPVPSANQPIPHWYRDLSSQVTQADFESLLCREIEPVILRRKGEYTLDCTFGDMQDRFVIKQVIKRIEKMIAKSFSPLDADDPTYKMAVQSATSMPLRSISLVAPQSMPKNTATGLVHLANGKILQGILSLVKKKN